MLTYAIPGVGVFIVNEKPCEFVEGKDAEYKLALDADTNGVSLCAYLDEVTSGAMHVVFGAGKPGYEDDEKGYGGAEWTFEAEDGEVFNVYSRFNAFRVGARDEARASHFASWLRLQIRKAVGGAS